MYIDIFAAKNMSSFCNTKATHIFFSAKTKINVFAVFQDRNVNITLANNFLKFLQLGPGNLSISLSVTDILHSSLNIFFEYH